MLSWKCFTGLSSFRPQNFINQCISLPQCVLDRHCVSI